MEARYPADFVFFEARLRRRRVRAFELNPALRPSMAAGMPVAMVTPLSGGAQEIRYINADRQGSVLALSSATGALVEGPYTGEPLA